jgi:hypothetical protein
MEEKDVAQRVVVIVVSFKIATSLFLFAYYTGTGILILLLGRNPNVRWTDQKHFAAFSTPNCNLEHFGVFFHRFLGVIR